MSRVICKNCRNDCWDIEEWNNRAICWNCGFERPYHTRNRRVDQMTPSQERAVKSIRRFFERNYLYGKDKLHKFEMTLQDETGLVYVSVKTSGHILTEDGGHFVIGRRGKVECLSAYSISARKDEIIAHYNYMLRKR